MFFGIINTGHVGQSRCCFSPTYSEFVPLVIDVLKQTQNYWILEECDTYEEFEGQLRAAMNIDELNQLLRNCVEVMTVQEVPDSTILRLD